MVLLQRHVILTQSYNPQSLKKPWRYVNSHTTWTRMMDIDYIKPAPTFFPHTLLVYILWRAQYLVKARHKSSITPLPTYKIKKIITVFMTTIVLKNCAITSFHFLHLPQVLPSCSCQHLHDPKNLFLAHLFNTERSIPYWVASCFTPWPTTLSLLACCPLSYLYEDPWVTHSFTHPDDINSARKLRYLNSSTLPILKPNLSQDVT